MKLPIDLNGAGHEGTRRILATSSALRFMHMALYRITHNALNGAREARVPTARSCEMDASSLLGGCSFYE